MKKIFLSMVLLGSLTMAFAQQPDPQSHIKKFTVGADLFTDIWQGNYESQNPGMSTKSLNRGVEMFGMYNIPMEKTPLTFCLGVGIGVHNLYTNSLLVMDDHSGAYHFEPISGFLGSSKSLSYKESKITVTYFDIPFEFRYKSKSDFKLALGMKFGFVLGSHTKYKGDDFISGTNSSITMKVLGLKNLERWRYGLTAKLGYRFVEFMGYYSFTNLFKKDQGPEMYPISIGISLRPF